MGVVIMIESARYAVRYAIKWGEVMSEWDRQQQGQKYEGYAFTFCKAAFLVLIFQKYALLVLSGLATVYYLLASWKGVTTWRCWAKPPYVTIFWAGICVWQIILLVQHYKK